MVNPLPRPSDVKINAVRVLVRNSKGEVLVARSRMNPNKYVLPGGKVEKSDPDLKSALARELLEETGYLCDKSKLIQCKEAINLQYYKATKELKHLLIFILPSDKYLKLVANPQPGEEDFGWIPFEEYKKNEQCPFVGEYVENLLKVIDSKNAPLYNLRKPSGFIQYFLLRK